MGDVVDLGTGKLFKPSKPVKTASENISIDLHRTSDGQVAYEIYGDTVNGLIPMDKMREIVGCFSFYFAADDVEKPICRMSVFKKDYAKNCEKSRIRVEFAERVDFSRWRDRWWVFKTLLTMYFEIIRGDHETR